MRRLNTNLSDNNYGRFTLPGFRSNSLIKRIIACLYYFFVIIFMSVLTIQIVSIANFSGIADVLLLIVLELLMLFIFLAPILALGFSNHYDWHGIKLILIILISWCVLYTAAAWVETLFSSTFISSLSTGSANEKDIKVTSDASEKIKDTNIDDKLIEDNIKEYHDTVASDAASSDADFEKKGSTKNKKVTENKKEKQEN